MLKSFVISERDYIKGSSMTERTFTFDDKWNIRFMQQAQLVSTWSKDPSTKVGCIIVSPNRVVLSEGYNGFPQGIKDTEERLHDRVLKYPRVVHAETNAIVNAGRNGAKIEDGILFVTAPPCPNCAKMIVQAGLREILYIDLDESKKNIPGWRDELGISFDMFNEVGIPHMAIPNEYLFTKEQLAEMRTKQLKSIEK